MYFPTRCSYEFIRVTSIELGRTRLEKKLTFAPRIGDERAAPSIIAFFGYVASQNGVTGSAVFSTWAACKESLGRVGATESEGSNSTSMPLNSWRVRGCLLQFATVAGY
jgi:hypothetical protein